jgi:hypothetical protein
MSLLRVLPFLILAACATTHPDPRLTLISEGQYRQIIESNMRNEKVYDGFMNVMDVSAVELNHTVLEAQADHNARIYQWDPTQYATEKQKSLASLPQQTDFFVSFFVPDRKHDDLHKPNTKWKIFLDINGKRIEPKEIKRVKALLVELQEMYPHHSRWHTPYKITFPIPASDIEKMGAKLTFTGPVGSLTLDFPPVAH